MEEKAKKISGEVDIPNDFFLEISSIVSVQDFQSKLEKHSLADVSQIIQLILGGSIVLRASDIHIETEEEKVKFRVRIDGVLQDVFSFNQKTYKALLSRVKLVSELKLNITQKSQDGRFSVSFPEIENKKIAKNKPSKMVEIRASTLPSEYGETIVLRILNPESLADLEALGLTERNRALLEKEIKKPNGMIIVTGPTGSGKTTTLYAVLKKIRKPEIKIVTIEDPVEYHLSGISQTEVHQEKGYDFANGLRAIVRQDPDVILVGEIRDLETAQISLQAALTGHLVLSTLHTNDASGAVARLQALGEESHNISSAVNLIIAQRLIRKVCSCAKKEKISPEEYQRISEEKIEGFSLETEILKANGCPECNHTGYQGRIAVFEFLLIDEEIENFILTNPSSSSLKRKAIEKGMLTMYQDGLLKVLENKTTLEELERVVGQ
jgi:general secretion pathway protein E